MNKVNENLSVSDGAEYRLISTFELFLSGGSAVVRDGGRVDVWSGGRAVVHAGGSAVVRDGGRAVVWAGGRAVVRDGGSAVVRARGSAVVWAGGSAVVWAGGRAVVRDGGSADVRDRGSAVVHAGGRAVVRDGGRAFKYDELARISDDGTYELVMTPDGMFYAGCRGPLTREQALKHWDREDDRACLFTLAILLCTEEK